jgi:hypothetical protein
MSSSLFVIVLGAAAAGLLLLVKSGGRRLAAMAGGLLLSIPTYFVVGLALAGRINPHATRFQPYPFTSINDHVSNVLFWGSAWVVVLFFLLPELGKRWG